MTDQRQEDYDGRVNYEFIKLLSAAKAATNTAHR